jgi:hypothetical protein
VDEETGLTFGVFMFQHKGLTTIKIKNGKIRDVEAIGIRLPYGMGSGWE